MILEGIYVPLTTPFAADLSIDFDAFGEMIDWQVAQGVHGLVIGGSTGEFFALTLDERKQQLRFAAERIGGRVALVAGINDLRAERCYTLARAAREAGAGALLVAAPPYALPRPAELAAHCRAIDQAADLPIILYNYPARTGVHMDDAFLEEATAIGNVCAIKESSGDVDRIQQLVLCYPQLQLSAGAEDRVLEFFAWGARSWVSVIANFMPRVAVRLYETCVHDGDFDRGRRAVRALLPLMHCLERGGAFLPSVKAACEAMRRPGGPVRPPLAALHGTERDEIDRTVHNAYAAARDILGA